MLRLTPPGFFTVVLHVTGVLVVVDLSQALMDDPQKSYSCAWKADELITVSAWVHENAGAFPECEVKTQMTPDHTAFWVGTIQHWSVFRRATRRLRLVVYAAGW